MYHNEIHYFKIKFQNKERMTYLGLVESGVVEWRDLQCSYIISVGLDRVDNSFGTNELTNVFKETRFTLSGSLLSFSHPLSPEHLVTPESTTGMTEGGVGAQPPPMEVGRSEGAVLVQPPNGRELWRMNWAGLRPVGGGICEEEEAEEGGACCWDWFWLACERICTKNNRQSKINSIKHPL